MKNAIISIGESVHASIPKTGKRMQELVDQGASAYTEESPALDYIRGLVESQADDGADYIAVNLDAFGEQDQQVTIALMIEYVRLVRKWSKGVPICIDSSSDDVLIAGLKEWYNTTDPVPVPLLNSVKTYTTDTILALRQHYDFSFIGLLVGEEVSAQAGGSYSVDQLYAMAKEIYQAAVQQGFKPGQMFFDSTVFPLAIDMPMESGVAGYTYRAFETVKKIKNDPAMKGVHCSLGVSNCMRDLPGRRIGVCRAYVAKGMEYGLDAGIVNVAHHYGSVEPASDLLDMVDAYAKMDGTPDKTNRAIELMGTFCQVNRRQA
jgi:5-methyltetrahydrofolate corrinoid/iron sulfur protein methyltransferase